MMYLNHIAFPQEGYLNPKIRYYLKKKSQKLPFSLNNPRTTTTFPVSPVFPKFPSFGKVSSFETVQDFWRRQTAGWSPQKVVILIVRESLPKMAETFRLRIYICPDPWEDFLYLPIHGWLIFMVD